MLLTDQVEIEQSIFERFFSFDYSIEVVYLMSKDLSSVGKVKTVIYHRTEIEMRNFCLRCASGHQTEALAVFSDWL